MSGTLPGVPATQRFLSGRFPALRHRNFQLFWSGQLVSLVGTWMQSVGQGWLMHRLTASAFMLGLLGFFQFIPIVFLSLWAGVVADHHERRRLMLITQSLAMIQATTLAVLVTTKVVEPWMVIALACAFGTINAFDLPARQAIVVEMVGKDDLTNAIALNSTAFNIARILGPAVAGVLVAVTGEAGCFWINAVSYVAVIFALTRIRLPAREAAPDGTRGFAKVLEGVRYARSTRPLRNLLTLLGVTAGFGFQYMVLLPVYARDILHAGPEAYGLMVSAFGLGSLLAALWMTRRQDRWALRRNLLVGLTTGGIGLTAFAWSRTLPLNLFGGFLSGFGLILYVASTNMLLQLTTEDRFRGRVMSLYMLMFVGTAPAGALMAGAVAQRFGAPIATTISAVVLLGGALWVAYRLRVLAAREAAQPTEPVVTEKLG